MRQAHKSSLFYSQHQFPVVHIIPQQNKQTVFLPNDQPVFSIHIAMFGMMSVALGTGILNLPMRISYLGIIPFIIYVLAAGITSYIGCIFLQSLIKKGYQNYGSICQAAYGNFLKRLLQVCIILFPWGNAVCFQVIIVKYIIQLLVDVFSFDLFENKTLEIYNETGQLLRLLLNFGFILTNFVLIQLKDLRPLQKLSLIGIVSTLYCGILIIIYMLKGFTTEQDIQYLGIAQTDWSKCKIFNNQSSVSTHLQAISSIIYCYTNHQLVFPTCRNMEKPTTKRLRKCFFRVNFYLMILFIVTGLTSYFLLMQHQDILPIKPIVILSIDTGLMSFGVLSRIFSLFIVIPLNLFPARTVVFEATDLQIDNKTHYTLTIVLTLASFAIAITYTNVNAYFGLLGAIGIFMSSIIPSLCYYKLKMQAKEKKRNSKNYLILIFVGIVCTSGIAGGVLSAING